MRVKSKNSVDTAYECILDNIIQRNLKPGETVTENSMSERFGLGRTPIREALKKLEQEGLIVTENRTKKIYYLSPEDLSDIFDIKIVLESAIAGWAAECTDLELRNRLANIITSMEGLAKGNQLTKNPQEALLQWLNLDNAFHDLISEMAGNKKVLPIIKVLNVQWHRLKIGIVAIEGRMGNAIAEHCAIGTAILNNNPKLASQRMGKHITTLKDTLLTMMRAFG